MVTVSVVILLIILFYILFSVNFRIKSTKLNRILNWVGEKILLMGGVLYTLFPTNPFNISSSLSFRDPGVFLYIAWRIHNGELPYRDVWDHKPPIIFYIDALGMAISKNLQWGIWILEFISLFIAAFIGYKLMQKYFGHSGAFFATFLWLMTLVFVLQGGNFTEEFALPFQFLCLWMVHDFEEWKTPLKRLFIIGLIIGILFFLKQTTIGIGIAITGYLIIRGFSKKQVKDLIKKLVVLAAGFISVFIVITTFFALQNAFHQFIDLVFTYNFIYASSVTGLMNRLKPLLTGIKPLTTTGLFQVALSGYVYSIYLFFFKKDCLNKWLPLLTIGLIALPIEFFMISMSGNTYGHYYITMLPVLSLFTGILFWATHSKLLKSNWKGPINVGAAFTICITGIFYWGSFWAYQNLYIDYRGRDDRAIIAYITERTTPDESVLFWGAESSANYFSQRKSPTQYVYQYPLYKEGYVTEQMIIEFLEAIIQQQPKFIFDTQNPTTPIFNFPIKNEFINEQIEYLQMHYLPVDNIKDWIIYEYVEN